MSDPQLIRNFAIIAHVDHGKSTLADRFLEITHTVDSRQIRPQYLDSNPIERERGITIKLAPVRMHYTRGGINYILNLIDTPGHVDFSYEVNRSLAACEGALLLVDATQGVQAQTLAHFRQAQKLGLTVIPVINKVDVASADIEKTRKQLIEVLGITTPPHLISAKTNQGVEELLATVIAHIPPPAALTSAPTRALVFNSNFDAHQGVIAWVRVEGGTIRTHDTISLLATRTHCQATQVGIFTPEKTPTPFLSTGEVGYITTSLKDVSRITIGDTLTVPSASRQLPSPLPGYQPIQPVVFISLYPIDGDQINLLRDALGRLKLSDSSFTYAPESSPALGNGFRIGLLGLLHADIIQERLEREFNLSLIASAPSVSFEIVKSDNTTTLIHHAKDLPDPSQVAKIREPILNLSLLVPDTYLGAVMQLCQSHRGTLTNMQYIGQLVHLSYRLPFSELIHHFYDQLKSVSSGFATLDYQLDSYEEADLVRLDILIAGDRIDALSQIVPRERATTVGRSLVENLKELIPRHQFEISLQAAIGGKILARTNIPSFRKDVTAKLYGGDQTRKDKLLEKQKKGKQRLKRLGKVDIPQEALLAILKTD